MKKRQKTKYVLVTGSAGAVGRPVCRWLLERGYRVRGFDRRPTPHVEDHEVADLADRERVRRAVEGMDAVIHLAAFRDDADFLDHLLEPNVRGLYHVCDAARHGGVRRLVLASSLQAVEGHGWRSGTIRIEDGPRPVNHYALTKVWAELLGEMYARCYGLSAVSVRIGWLPRDVADAQRLGRHEIGPDVYLSHNDAGRFVGCCVESPSPAPGEFAVVFATSRPANRTILDLEPALRVLGYEPQDTWPEGLAFSLET